MTGQNFSVPDGYIIENFILDPESNLNVNLNLYFEEDKLVKIRITPIDIQNQYEIFDKIAILYSLGDVKPELEQEIELKIGENKALLYHDEICFSLTIFK